MYTLPFRFDKKVIKYAGRNFEILKIQIYCFLKLYFVTNWPKP